jgi:hypothetical protein
VTHIPLTDFDRLDYAACETASVPTASPARGWPAGHDVEVTACPIQPPGAEVCIPRAAPAHGSADLGLTICLRRDFTEGAAPSSHPGTTFAAIGRDSRASALAGRSSVERLVFVAA